jgi:hypothetical protein
VCLLHVQVEQTQLRLHLVLALMEPNDTMAAGYAEETEEHATNLWTLTNDLFIGGNGLTKVTSLTDAEVLPSTAAVSLTATYGTCCNSHTTHVAVVLAVCLCVFVPVCPVHPNASNQSS